MKLFRRCRHERVRCVHGDEINWRSGRVTVRAACLDCDASLPKLDLPAICHYNGEAHDAYLLP